MTTRLLIWMSFLLLVGCGDEEQGGGAAEGPWPAMCVVAPVVEKRVDDTLRLVATLAAPEQVQLVSEIDAALVAIEVEEGQEVAQDQVLFRLDDVQARAREEEARAALALAQTTHERNEQLLEQKTISRQEFDQGQAAFLRARAALAIAEDDVRKTVIRAPFDGVFGEKVVSLGQFATRGQQLGSLLQVDPLEAVFYVPERHVRLLREGLQVAFSSVATGEERYEGEVAYVAPEVAERSRAVRVKAELDAVGVLRPGMFGEVALVLQQREASVFIGEAAIMFKGSGTLVYVVNGSGVSELRPVQVGRRIEGEVEIVEGLVAGERVVLEGHQNQKMGPGMQVIAAPESEQYGISPGPMFAVPEAEGAPVEAGDVAP